MTRRGFLIILLGAAALLALLRWGDLPSDIRPVESLLRPVFHKEIVDKYALRYHEDPLFITSVIKVESNFFKAAKSHRGATGLMQIMPRTASEIADELKIRGFAPVSLEDPDTNIRFGIHYLAKLRKEFGDDVAVLAAYNAGPKNVRDWIQEIGTGKLEIADIPFYETANFVHDVLSTYNWLKRFQKVKNKIVKTAQ